MKLKYTGRVTTKKSSCCGGSSSMTRVGAGKFFYFDKTGRHRKFKYGSGSTVEVQDYIGEQLKAQGFREITND